MQIVDKLAQVEFSTTEIKCLIFISQAKKASLKRISRETNMTESLAQMMLDKLEQQNLIHLEGKGYVFCGVKNLINYLESERENSQQVYLQAINEAKAFFQVD